LRCIATVAASRPRFAELVAELAALQDMVSISKPT